MTSAGPVSVAGVDHETLGEQRSLGVDRQFGRPAHQPRRDEQLDVLQRESFVAAEVLALRIGVDRHLGELASADRSDEIDGDQPALLSSKLEGRFGDMDVHASSMADDVSVDSTSRYEAEWEPP